jgi:hypothetical protein
VENSKHFLRLIQEINLQNKDCLVSFEVVSLFTILQVEEVLQVLRNRLITDLCFPEHSPLRVEDITELLGTLLKLCTSSLRIYSVSKKKVWQWEIYYLRRPVILEYFEDTALDTADHRPVKRLRYVDDTFVVWPHEPARLQQFPQHLNSHRFTMEVETNDILRFLDVFDMKRGPKFATKL